MRGCAHFWIGYRKHLYQSYYSGTNLYGSSIKNFIPIPVPDTTRLFSGLVGYFCCHTFPSLCVPVQLPPHWTFIFVSPEFPDHDFRERHQILHELLRLNRWPSSWIIGQRLPKILQVLRNINIWRFMNNY